jgi:hypothetical protein
MRANDCTYVYIHLLARYSLYVHAHVVMITLVCTQIPGHDCAYTYIQVCARSCHACMLCFLVFVCVLKM